MNTRTTWTGNSVYKRITGCLISHISNEIFHSKVYMSSLQTLKSSNTNNDRCSYSRVKWKASNHERHSTTLK